ncbi:Calx-beta domain-containing protein [Anabaena azotica]|uniref:Calx-beta domain-containing protein n=1 Tax=Anabaena azotica TaxID=197653 RepID=UPI0039A5DC6F
MEFTNNVNITELNNYLDGSSFHLFNTIPYPLTSLQGLNQTNYSHLIYGGFDFLKINEKIEVEVVDFNSILLDENNIFNFLQADTESLVKQSHLWSSNTSQEIDFFGLTGNSEIPLVYPFNLLNNNQASFIQSRYDGAAINVELNSNFLAGILQQDIYPTLQQFVKLPNFQELMHSIFGDNLDAGKLTQITSQWLVGNFSLLPQIKVQEESVFPASTLGAFAGTTEKIYLSEKLFNSGNTEKIGDIILEEVGHWLDKQLNQQDTPGDEGKLFADIVRGKYLNAQEIAEISAEDDSTRIFIDGQYLTVEQATLPTITIAASDATAAETITGQTTNPGKFTIKRTGDLSSTLAVNYTVGGTATNGTDYNQLTGVATFSAGLSTTTIDLTVINDAILETQETVVVTLSSNSNYILGTATTATANIVDNDKPTITISASDAGAAETVTGQTANPGRFTLTRTGDLSSSPTINYTVAGTATNGTDFNTLTKSVSFAAGSATAIIDVNVKDDAVYEGNETVIVNLASSANYILGTAKTATVNLVDNDKPTITIAATDSSAAETLTGQTANLGKFTLTRTGNKSAALTVNYTVAGTATNGTDYNTLTKTVTFAAGSATAIIDVTPIDDAVYEGNETAIVTLASGTNYILGTAKTATVNLADNDSSTNVKPTITISASDANAGETVTGTTVNRGQFKFTRTGDLSASLTVGYSVGGTATNGVDYNSLSGTATFAAGASTALVNLSPIDDTAFEGDETVVVTLSSGTNYNLGTAKSATVTIVDNDIPIVPSMITVAATDSNAGETTSGQIANPGQFTITRTGTTSALTVNYTLSGTAINGTDYVSLNGVANFAAGVSTAVVTVTPIDDLLIEGNETVTLNLTAGTGYSIGANSSAVVSIADNDSLPTITISATDANTAETTIGQTANPGQFTITRTGSTASALNVNYTVTGSATNSVDYVGLSGTVTIQAGATTAVLPITVLDDSLTESPETVIVTLDTNSNYTLGNTTTAIVTIADNELPSLNITASDANAVETISGQTTNPGQFTITRTGSTVSALNVNYTVTGSATNSVDYGVLNGTLTIQAGATTAVLPITVLDDLVSESPETVLVTLNPSSSYILESITSAMVTIADNELPILNISALDANAFETISGQTTNPGQFTITRTGSTASALNVNYSITGSATNSVDYGGLSGTVTILAGATTAVLPITVLDDLLTESPETVVVTLSSNSSYTLGSTTTATVTISDNEYIFPDSAGNTLGASRLLTVNSGSSTYSDWIGNNDRNDFYRFNLNNSTTLNITLGQLSGDADIRLIKDRNNNQLIDAGEVIDISDLSDTNSEIIHVDSLSAGAYYLQVYTFIGDTNYNLAIVANPILNITSSQTSTGNLSSTDLNDPNRSGRFADDYQLVNVSPGQEIQINLISSSFDPYLQVVNALTGTIIAADDDSGDGNNSQLKFIVQDNTSYLIRASSYSSNTTGDYTLTSIPVAVGSITLNQTVTSNLSTTDLIDPARAGRLYDDYVLTGVSPGEEIQIKLNSTNFDPYLQLIDASTGAIIMSDDDSGEGNNSQLTFMVRTGVDYRLRVSSYAEGATGSYSLITTNIGTIQGKIWNDQNRNGVLDTGEVGIAGVKVYIDQNDNQVLDIGELSTITRNDDLATSGINETGYYEFTGLAAGVYTVRQVVPNGYRQTSPGNGFGSRSLGDGYADFVLDYYDSGLGPMPGPYGGTKDSNPDDQIVPVNLGVVLGSDPISDSDTDFLSLPTNSYVTVGFTDETVIDGPGNDIFIREFEPAGDEADIYVSSNLIDFIFLGTAFGGITTELDLASISFREPVRAIKIVGRNLAGYSPGFDVVNVQVLQSGFGPSPDAYTITVRPGETTGNLDFGASTQPTLQTVRPYQPIQGSLSTTDARNFLRSGSFADDYRLIGVSPGQNVKVNLNSTNFDPYVQLLNASTGNLIAFDDDSGEGSNSQLSFTVQAGIDYVIRTTSYGSDLTGNYSLSITSSADHVIYEKLAKQIVYGLNLNGTALNLQKNSIISLPNNNSYVIKQIFEVLNGFYAFGLESTTGSSPVLVIRGTEPLANFGADIFSDADYRGVGFNQYLSALVTRNADGLTIGDWLRSVSTTQSPTVDIIGHSLGGALAQLLSAQFANIVRETVTFNSPGIAYSMVDLFENNGGHSENVTHYIVNGDPVSLAGLEYLPGKFSLLSFSERNILENHLRSGLLDSGRGGSVNFSQKWFSSVDDLNSLLFYHQDPDYFAFQLALAALPVPGAAALSAALTFRGTTESFRINTGIALQLLGDAIELIISDSKFLTAANIASRWGSFVWDNISHWKDDNWKAISQWNADKLTKASQWKDHGWQVASQWSADKLQNVMQWSNELWQASANWSDDIWEQTTYWSADAWQEISKWNADAWQAASQWSSDKWQKTRDWSANQWKETAKWTADIWNKTTKLPVDAFNNITNWISNR